MSEAIGQVLAFAVVVSISPIPIIGMVLMLSTPRARSNGPAFILGWIAGLSAVGLIVLAVANGAGVGDGGSADDSTNVLKLVLGIVAVVLAARQWRRRPRAGETPLMPSWMDAIDHFTSGRAAALGIALSAVNPKNLLLVVAAAAAVSETGASTADQLAALAVFVIVATLGPGIPLAVYFFMGERSKPILEELRGWMSAHNNAIMAVILLVIGAKLIGDALGGF